MKSTDLMNLIKARYNAGIKRVLHIESSPGLGKTQLVEQAAKAMNVGFMKIHAPLMQPEDYGFPVISADKSDVSFIVSKSKFPLVGSNCADHGIFLCDETSQADVSGQKILANLFQEHEIHGQRIKPGWLIISTGNRAGDKAGANRLLSHLRNRVTTMEFDASVDDWTTWALKNNVKTEIIAFLRFRPELLTNFDPQQDINATPRSWVEGVSAQLGVIDSAHEFQTFKGDVGEGPAAEFCAFLKVFRKLPNPDMIILDPKKSAMPSDPATLYALCGALSARASKDNFGRIMQYIERMPTEFSVLFVRDALKCKGNEKESCECNGCSIKTTSDFIAWASGAGAKLLT